MQCNNSLEEAICGQSLFCLYSQSRWSDCQRLSSEPKASVEAGGPGVIEATASHTKDQRGYKRLRLATPITSLAYSVSGERWWEKWLSARRSLNLPSTPALPDTDSSGKLVNKPMRPEKISSWLKGTLNVLGTPETEERPLGSHSCKATFQCWLARWGMSPAARRALGHHVKPGDRMPMVYSRDYIIGPLGGVVRMVSAIRSQQWDPDSAKSVLLKAAMAPKDYGGAAASSSTLPRSTDEEDFGLPSRKIEGIDMKDDKSVPTHAPRKEDAAASSGSDDSTNSMSSALSDEDEYNLDAVTEMVAGPCLNPRSRVIHGVVTAGSFTVCGLVANGFEQLGDLDGGVALGGGLCGKCYRKT